MALTKRELAEAHAIAYRLANESGCCWHVVLDDQNVDDAFVIGHEVDPTHQDCVAIQPFLERMSKTQRMKLSMGGYAGVALEALGSAVG